MDVLRNLYWVSLTNFNTPWPCQWVSQMKPTHPYREIALNASLTIVIRALKMFLSFDLIIHTEKQAKVIIQNIKIT